jgi:molybdopterin synthase sulfur carrier subunit
MASVWIPALLRDLTGGLEVLQVPGNTVREVIDHLDLSFPGIRLKLCDGNNLRMGIAVAVDAHVSRLGLLQPVAENSEVHFLPAVSGG